VVMNCFSLCSSWEVFISPLILKDNFAGIVISISPFLLPELDIYHFTLFGF
jgi:hypothetical protein